MKKKRFIFLILLVIAGILTSFWLTNPGKPRFVQTSRFTKKYDGLYYPYYQLNPFQGGHCWISLVQTQTYTSKTYLYRLSDRQVTGRLDHGHPVLTDLAHNRVLVMTRVPFEGKFLRKYGDGIARWTGGLVQSKSGKKDREEYWIVNLKSGASKKVHSFEQSEGLGTS